jgi:hypothetical protein
VKLTAARATQALTARFRWACVWLLGLAAWPTLALAQPSGDIPVRPIAVTIRDAYEAPALSFSVRDLVDSDAVKKLQSGLPQTITTRIYVYSERSREPLTVAALSCRVVYDLWEGVYRIERQTEASDKTLTSRALDGVVTQCLTFQNYTIGAAKLLERVRGKQVYFAVVSELNPLSPDAVQRIRRWLARPSGSELNGGAFFGSFVSIFVGRKLGDADKIVTFRSPAHAVPP